MFIIAHCNSCHSWLALKPQQDLRGFPPSITDPLQSEAIVSAPFVVKEQWEAETLTELSASIREEEGHAYAGSLVCLECVNTKGKSVIDIIEPAAVLTTNGSWLFLYKHHKMPKETGYD
jgi:hypothetical protein